MFETERRATLKESLLGRAARLRAGTDRPDAQARGPGQGSDATGLLFALALRGRTNPRSLLPADLADGAVVDALAGIAPFCDTGSGSEAGRWLLTDLARRRELDARTPDEILAALDGMPQPDDVSGALRVAYSATEDLNRLSARELGSLLAVEPALSDHAPGRPDPAELRRMLLLRQRKEEYERIVEGFVGRSEQIADLLAFISPRVPDTGNSSYYLFGAGGAGKSTLAAALMLLLLDEDSGVVPVHLDFDRSDLNVEEAFQLSLELFRQVGAQSSDANVRLKGLRDDLRRKLRSRATVSEEWAMEAASTDTLSLMSGALDGLAFAGMPLVVVIDTFEQVETSGARGLQSLRSWLDQIVGITGVPSLRLVVMGRSDFAQLPDGHRFLDLGPPTRVRRLDDLSPVDAADLLRSAGVPASLCAPLFDALGGNPLVLRLAAGMMAMDGGERELRDVAREVSAGRVPHAIVQGVLYDRFLKHLPDQTVCDYAHPGLVLPELTVDLIRNVLAPLLGQGGMSPGRARQIFEALAAASWLVRRQGDALVQRPDVRRLMLGLMTADGRRRADVVRIRKAALLYHRGRRSVRDRSLVAYHVLMDVRDKEDINLLAVLNLDGTGPFLRHHHDDLPELARTYVRVTDFNARGARGGRTVAGGSISAEQAIEELPDDLWAAYLDGDGQAGGEGERLVDKGDPLEALLLFRRRPTGSPGRPPTFVIQAIAESGDWDDRTVDVVALAVEAADLFGGRGNARKAATNRLYWSCRLALLAHPDAFERREAWTVQLAEAIRMAMEARASRSSARLPALACVMEALSGCRPRLIPGRLLDGRSALRDPTRMYLARALWQREAYDIQVSLDTLVCLQSDFAGRVERDGKELLRAGERSYVAPADPTTSVLRDVQRQVDALAGGRLYDLDRSSNLLRRRMSVRVSGIGSEPERRCQVALLRGSTPEFHRPARQALREALHGLGEAERLEFAEAVGRLLTVRPRDFEPPELAKRIGGDPVVWLLSLVQFCDRARVLGGLLEVGLQLMPGASKLRRTLHCFGRWDGALTAGLGSDWWARESPGGRDGLA